MAGSARRRRGRIGSEDGAALVEFAFVAPILILLVFGIIDFGWIFAQHQDVRHGAREGGRLAVVDWPAGSAATLAQEVCDRTESLKNSDTDVFWTITDTDGDTQFEAGEPIRLTVEYPTDSLTGFFSFLNIDLESTVEMRLEQDTTLPNQASGTYTCS